ncbi:MAG TPA: hypothetical protein VK509_25890, partial [Polyangiales bacterium]|nr:hypothetical protein [Polyangiales bacterium]
WLTKHRTAVRVALRAWPAAARLRARLATASVASGDSLRLSENLARVAGADDAQRRASAAREMEHALRPIALDHVAAFAQAEEPLLVARAPAVRAPEPGEPPPPPAPRAGGLLIVSLFAPDVIREHAPRDLPQLAELDSAARFLAGTDAAAQDAVERAVRGLGRHKPLPWHVLLRALRAPELDSESGRQQRWRRAASFLRTLGFDRELDARIRAEPDRGAALPFTTLVTLAPPRDVRTAQSPIDYGIASDVLAAEGVARALGLSLAHPALPPELRWPTELDPHPAGALGALALAVWGERTHLTRVHGLPAAAAERVGRAAGTFALLFARAQCALAIAPLADADGAQARLEALAESLGRALCCDVPLGVAGVLGADRMTARARALELLAGLALFTALRELCDEDWYRNPRSGELLRAGCARGHGTTPQAWCAELGTTLDAAVLQGEALVR